MAPLSDIKGDIVILTGAGISAESGLKTFRGADGLWEGHRVEDVATPEGFAADPALVHRFYSERRLQLREVAPNPAHQALARLQREHAGRVSIVTQNVDDLHERGGAAEVIHMHGELLQIRCLTCGYIGRWAEATTPDTACPNCQHTSLRPDIVWFGEMPYFVEDIYSRLLDCALFISIGTSGNVYPAAGFVQAVREAGVARSLEINLEPSAGASLFDECRHGAAGVLVPEAVDEILGGNGG